MSTVLESVRESNQRSTLLKSDWLEQLRYVRLGQKKDESNTSDSIPEITFVSIPDIAELEGTANQQADSSQRFESEHQKPKSDNSVAPSKSMNQDVHAAKPTMQDRDIEAFPDTTPMSINHEAAIALQLAGAIEPTALPAGYDKIGDPVEQDTEQSHESKSTTSHGGMDGGSLVGSNLNASLVQQYDVQTIVNNGIGQERSGADKRETSKSAGFQFANTEQNPAIEQVTDRILESFPAVTSAVLMFSGVDVDSKTDSIAAKVAGCLAARKIGKVLMIDANVARPRLTQFQKLGENEGFTDLLSYSGCWAKLAQKTDQMDLEFIPRGLGNYSMINSDPAKITKLITTFKDHYVLTCINAGHYADAVTSSLGGYIDGTYMVLSLDETDEAEALVAHRVLLNQRARVLGCIATQSSL